MTVDVKSRCRDCERTEGEGAADIIDGLCEACKENYWYCELCKEMQPRDCLCRHLFWYQELSGPGSYDGHDFKKEVWRVLDYAGRAFASDLVEALKADTAEFYHHGPMLGPYIVGMHCKDHEYFDIFSLGETPNEWDMEREEIDLLNNGVAWLTGMWPDAGTFRDMTIGWIEEWFLVTDC